jgi:hypothetical protein
VGRIRPTGLSILGQKEKVRSFTLKKNQNSKVKRKRAEVGLVGLAGPCSDQVPTGEVWWRPSKFSGAQGTALSRVRASARSRRNPSGDGGGALTVARLPKREQAKLEDPLGHAVISAPPRLWGVPGGVTRSATRRRSRREPETTAFARVSSGGDTVNRQAAEVSRCSAGASAFTWACSPKPLARVQS